MEDYRVLKFIECPTCKGKGYTITKRTWLQKFFGIPEREACGCWFDAKMGTHVIVDYVSIEEVNATRNQSP